MVSNVTEDSEVKKIEASKTLQNKVGTGNISTEKIAKAQKTMDENKADFNEIARPYMRDLKAALGDVDLKSDDKDAQKQLLIVPIMNLKANAATFNYPLISGIAGTVLTFVESLDELDKKVVKIINLLHMTITLILARKLAGNGGADGQALHEAFRQVCHKYTMQKLRKA